MFSLLDLCSLLDVSELSEDELSDSEDSEELDLICCFWVIRQDLDFFGAGLESESEEGTVICLVMVEVRKKEQASLQTD